MGCRKSIAFVRCASCGCITHWRPLVPERGLRTGINARNFTPEQLGPVPIRLLDGAVTERYIGEIPPPVNDSLSAAKP